MVIVEPSTFGRKFSARVNQDQHCSSQQEGKANTPTIIATRIGSLFVGSTGASRRRSVTVSPIGAVVRAERAGNEIA